jgi:chromosomal replication initiation ATPase DnaA
MADTSEQLLLPLGSVPRFGREDFLIGKANEAAFAYMDRWPRWLAPAAVLIGPMGAGKSHLCAIFTQIAQARMMRADHLTRDDVPILAQGRAVVLEDCDRFAPDEVALFHLLNLARETGVFVVLSARQAPDSWGVKTPDLLSRLRLAPLLALAEPDDGLLGALLVKLFADKQVKIETNVITYAMARIERSYGAVNALVEALDRQSLVQKKPISRAMVAQALGQAEDSELEDEDDFPA